MRSFQKFEMFSLKPLDQPVDVLWGFSLSSLEIGFPSEFASIYYNPSFFFNSDKFLK